MLNNKGLLDGTCNRTACQRRGANWYSSAERAHYCEPCALKINRWIPVGVAKLAPVAVPATYANPNTCQHHCGLVDGFCSDCQSTVARSASNPRIDATLSHPEGSSTPDYPNVVKRLECQVLQFRAAKRPQPETL
jgi:hypothetical protein